MTTITADDLKRRILALWPKARVLSRPRESRLFVLSKDYVLGEWNAWWQAYKQERGLDALPNRRGACWFYSEAAVSEMNLALLRNQGRKEELAVAACPVNLMLRLDVTLNEIVGPGSHSTVLIALSDDEEIDIYFWEPQAERPGVTLCRDSGVSDLFDALT